MLKQDRQAQILQLLQQQGRVEVRQLCALFGVAKMTIRRDLETLAQQGKLSRTHGGAVPLDSDLLLEAPFALRLEQEADRKDRIARLAAQGIADGEKLFLSSGSTAFSLAQHLDNSKRLLVVTDGLNAALELSRRTSISVIVVGGELRPNTLSTTGAFAEDMLRQFTFEAAYLGVTGLGRDGRLYHGSLVERGLFEALSACTRRRVILADTRKIGREDFVAVGQLGANDTLITNDDAPEDCLAAYRELGVNVQLA